MRKFHYTHIIWDWNGTLFDDAWLCIEIMNGMLSRRGLPRITPERYEQIFDFPVIDYYRTVGFDFYEEPFEKLSDEFIAAYHRRMWECELRDSARETLILGQRRGISQAVLSAMKQETLDEMLEHFELRDMFADVVGLIDHHAFGKLETAEEWILTQSAPRAQMVLIGDTAHDFDVAAALGVDCWHIHSGHHSRARLAANGVPVIESLMDLYLPDDED